MKPKLGDFNCVNWAEHENSSNVIKFGCSTSPQVPFIDLNTLKCAWCASCVEICSLSICFVQISFNCSDWVVDIAFIKTDKRRRTSTRWRLWDSFVALLGLRTKVCEFHYVFLVGWISIKSKAEADFRFLTKYLSALTWNSLVWALNLISKLWRKST